MSFTSTPANSARPSRAGAPDREASGGGDASGERPRKGQAEAVVEDIGGTLEVGARTGVSMRVRAEDLALAVDVLADLAMRPVSRPTRSAGRSGGSPPSLRGRRRRPGSFRADATLPRPRLRPTSVRTRPEGHRRASRCSHPRRRRRPPRPLLHARQRLPRRRRRLRPEAASRPSPEAKLGDWYRPAACAAKRAALHPDRPDAPRVKRVARPGEQVHVLIGHLGVTRRHADYDALVILDHILGSGPGFTDRLSRVLRDELGLAYAVGGGMTDLGPTWRLGLFRGLRRHRPRRGPTAPPRPRPSKFLPCTRAVFSDDEVDRAPAVSDRLMGLRRYQTARPKRRPRLLELERTGTSPGRPQLQWPDRVARVTARQVRPRRPPSHSPVVACSASSTDPSVPAVSRRPRMTRHIPRSPIRNSYSRSEFGLWRAKIRPPTGGILARHLGTAIGGSRIAQGKFSGMGNFPNMRVVSGRSG